MPEKKIVKILKRAPLSAETNKTYVLMKVPQKRNNAWISNMQVKIINVKGQWITTKNIKNLLFATFDRYKAEK